MQMYVCNPTKKRNAFSWWNFNIIIFVRLHEILFLLRQLWTLLQNVTSIAFGLKLTTNVLNCLNYELITILFENIDLLYIF